MAAKELSMALANVENALRTVKTDLNTHLGLQASMGLIKDALKEKSEPEEEKDADSNTDQ
jgi:hypothetical protein